MANHYCKEKLVKDTVNKRASFVADMYKHNLKWDSKKLSKSCNVQYNAKYVLNATTGYLSQNKYVLFGVNGNLNIFNIKRGK